MTDFTDPTPPPLDELGQEVSTTILPDVEDPVLDIRQGFIVAVDPATNTYTFRYPESTADLGPARSILPCAPNDTVWVLNRGGMSLILGPQDKGGPPPGSAILWFTATPPSGWVIADGSSTAAYPRLNALFGANLPDLRGRVAIGAGTGAGLTNRALGGTGGEENHQLTEAELAVHDHGVADPGHAHPRHIDWNTTDKTHSHSGHTHQMSEGQGDAMNGYDSFNGVAGTGLTVSNAGGNVAHNNMQPWRGVHFIIKW